MPDPVTGITAGTAIVGAGLSYKASQDAAKSAAASEAASLAFEQQKYDDWQATYGGIEDNLAQYYGGLTADYYEAQGLEAFAQEQEVAFTKMRETLAQRGIDPDSGVALALEQDQALTEAEGKARIRTMAPSMAADEQMRFLQVGMGQSPGASMSTTLANQAAGARDRANVASSQAGQAVGNAVSTVGTALGDYYREGQE